MTEDLVFVVVEGEPFLSRCEEFKERQIAFQKAWREFAKEMGANKASGFFNGCRPHSLVFGRAAQREGWTKIDRHGYSRPYKKNRAGQKAWKALPVSPSPQDIFGDSLITSLSYESKGSCGVRSLVAFLGVRIGWTGGKFIAVIPHAGKAAQRHMEKYPESRITNGADKWQMPEGLREISAAEKDLIFAQYAVEQEKSAS